MGSQASEILSILRYSASVISDSQKKLPSTMRLHLFIDTDDPKDATTVDTKDLFSNICNFTNCPHKGPSAISQGLAFFKVFSTGSNQLASSSTSQPSQNKSQDQSVLLHASVAPSQSGNNIQTAPQNNDTPNTNTTAAHTSNVSDKDKEDVERAVQTFQTKMIQENIFSWFPGESESYEIQEPQSEDEQQEGSGDAPDTSQSSRAQKHKKGKRKTPLYTTKGVIPDNTNTLIISALIVHIIGTVPPNKILKIYQQFFRTLHSWIKSSKYYTRIMNQNKWSGKMSYKSFTAPWFKHFTQVTGPNGASCMPSNPFKVRSNPDVKHIRSKTGATMALRILSAFYDVELEVRPLLRKITLDISGVLLSLYPGQVFVNRNLTALSGPLNTVLRP